MTCRTLLGHVPFSGPAAPALPEHVPDFSAVAALDPVRNLGTSMISIRQGKNSFPCAPRSFSAPSSCSVCLPFVFCIYPWANGQAVTRHLFACSGPVETGRSRRLSLGLKPAGLETRTRSHHALEASAIAQSPEQRGPAGNSAWQTLLFFLLTSRSAGSTRPRGGPGGARSPPPVSGISRALRMACRICRPQGDTQPSCAPRPASRDCDFPDPTRARAPGQGACCGAGQVWLPQ